MSLLTQKEANAILGVKQCTLCGDPKHLDQFYKRKSMRDGHRSECKECSDKSRTERKQRQLEKETLEKSIELAKKHDEAYSLVMGWEEKKEPISSIIFNYVAMVGFILAMVYMILDGITK